MKTRAFYILLTDLIHSKVLANRQEATRAIKKAITKVNDRFAKDMYAPMEITRGDETAAVLTSLNQLYDFLVYYLNELQPFRFRIVVTHGLLTAGIHDRKSAEMDGPGFYMADETMRQLKKTRKLFQLKTDKNDYDTMVTGLINLLLFRRDQLTDFQLSVAELYGKGMTQREIAKKLKRTPQQVSQAIKAIPCDVYDEAEQAVRLLLKNLNSSLRKYA